jgi:hypothetical protein
MIKGAEPHVVAISVPNVDIAVGHDSPVPASKEFSPRICCNCSRPELAHHVDLGFDREGRYRGVTGPTCGIGKTAAHEDDAPNRSQSQF